MIFSRFDRAMLGLLGLCGVELFGEMDNECDEALHVGFFAHAWFGRDLAAGARYAEVTHGGKVRTASPQHSATSGLPPIPSRCSVELASTFSRVLASAVVPARFPVAARVRRGADLRTHCYRGER